MPLELRLTEAALRQMAHDRIAAGVLPGIPRISLITVIPGRGARCCLCDGAVQPHQLQYTILDSLGGRRTSLHVWCHAIWRDGAERMLTGSDGDDR